MIKVSAENCISKKFCLDKIEKLLCVKCVGIFIQTNNLYKMNRKIIYFCVIE